MPRAEHRQQRLHQNLIRERLDTIASTRAQELIDSREQLRQYTATATSNIETLEDTLNAVAESQRQLQNQMREYLVNWGYRPNQGIFYQPETRNIKKENMISRTCRNCSDGFRIKEPEGEYYEDMLSQFCPRCSDKIVFTQPESWLHSDLIGKDNQLMESGVVYPTNVDITDLPDNVKLEIANYIAKQFGAKGLLYPNFDCHYQARQVVQIIQQGDFSLIKDANKPSIPKRVSQYLFKQSKLRMTPDMLQHIGNIVEQNAEQLQEWFILQTRDLTHRRTYYGNEKSCWWTEQAHSIENFKRVGGFAVMGMYKNKLDWPEYYPEHRVWCLPLSSNLKIADTNDTLDYPAYLFFNAYSQNAKINARQITAAFCNVTGFQYKPVHAYCHKINIYLNPTWHCLVYNPDKINPDLIDTIEDLEI